MKEKITNKLPLVLTVIGTLVLLFALAFLGFKDKNVVHTTNNTKSHSDYVLVNEDAGQEFNGKRYQLGADFVTLINQDSKNNWETASRNVANAGVKSGQYDAEIIIPRNFSTRLLNLKSETPEKALVSYRVRDSQNAISNEQVANKVNGILKDFNQRIVQMYFSNIVGNLSEAQHNVNNMVGAEKAQTTNLSNTYAPVKELPHDFDEIVNTSSLLSESNADFNIEQEAFVKEVNSLLQDNQRSLADGSKTAGDAKSSVSENNKQNADKLAQSLALFDRQYQKQKEQLALQSENDSSGYNGQFGEFHNVVRSQMLQFGGQDDEGSVYQDYLHSAKYFQETQYARIKELKEEIDSLDKQLASMNKLKHQISGQFWGNDAQDYDPINAKDEMVKKAIIKQIDMVGKGEDNHLDERYLKSISSLAYLNRDDFDKLLGQLQKNDQLGQDEANQFKDAYTVLSRAVPEGGTNHLELVDDQPELNTETKNIPITIPLDINKLSSGQGQRLTFTGDGIDADLSKVAGEIKNTLDHQYGGSTSTTVQGNSIQIKVTQTQQKDDEQKEEPKDGDGNSDETSKNTKASVPTGYQTTARVSVPMNVKSVVQGNDYATQDYSWAFDGESPFNKGALSTYKNVKDKPQQNVGKLVTEFADLKAGAQQVVSMYGSPDSQSISAFAKRISGPVNANKQLNELASHDSVYWMYGNMKPKDLEESISKSLIESYRNNAHKLYTDIDEQITALGQTLGTSTDNLLKDDGQHQPTLYGTYNLMAEPEQFLRQARQLNDWYQKANKNISSGADTWKQVEKIAPESILDDGDQLPEKTDDSSSVSQVDELGQTLDQLASSTQNSASATLQSAAQVKDVKPQVKELTNSINKVRQKANTVLSGLGDTVTKSQKNTNANDQYSKRFGQVMSNAKNGGADNPLVFNFLASPIQADAQLGAVHAISLVPYYATLIVALLILVFALSVREFMQKRQLTENDNLVTPHRWWENVPNVIMILLSALVVSSVFAGVLVHFAGGKNQMMLFIYSLLVALGGTLILTGAIRQFKKTTLVIYGSILGLFFILTPLLGVVTKPNSFASWLFRFSPFQNIQNGYTALLNNGTVGTITLIVLILAVVLGLALNFFVRPSEDEVQPETTEE
ncbi:type VII secretion protein EsaA [Ligilactobacillus pobuzihii]|uniref:type VII secretion protein EsaA n=1 Tax=Ligilactobacillus pobuzihii TaxID=449659 RepID=UPI0019D14DBA|nr:type VII secretion protein EsaA [Ligilactobacillus pobuzihii]MBN7274905.1 type VII secretion protein EsaA [Ligilactobacillus pobuzihii]